MKFRNVIICILVAFVIGVALGGLQRLFEIETILGMDGGLFAIIIGAISGFIIGIVIEKRTKGEVADGR